MNIKLTKFYCKLKGLCDRCLLHFVHSDLKIQRRDGNGNVKNNNKTKPTKIGLMNKTTTSQVHHISLPFLHYSDVKMPNFMENVNKQRTKFISPSELGYGLLEFNFRSEKVSGRVGRE